MRSHRVFMGSRLEAVPHPVMGELRAGTQMEWGGSVSHVHPVSALYPHDMRIDRDSFPALEFIVTRAGSGIAEVTLPNT